MSWQGVKYRLIIWFISNNMKFVTNWILPPSTNNRGKIEDMEVDRVERRGGGGVQ